MKIYLSGAVSAAALLAAMSLAQAQTEPRSGSGMQPETNVQEEKRSGAERDGKKADGEKRERAGQQQSQGAADDAQKKDGKREGAARDSAEKPDAKKRDAAQTGEKRDDAKKRDAAQTGEKPADAQKRDAAQTDEKPADAQKRDAAQTGEKPADAQTRDAAQTDGQKSAGSEPSRAALNITVTPQQKTRMRDVVRGGSIRRYNRSEVNFTLNVGTRIPETIVYYDPPPAFIEILPDVRNYKVIVLDDVILVVDPETREIIDVIEI